MAATSVDARLVDADRLLRRLIPQAVATLARRTRDFASAEDAVQEALVEAVRRWPTDGLPERPLGWLVTVAQRRHTDRIRAETARQRREERVAVPEAVDADADTDAASPEPAGDDLLDLMALCCHPALPTSSQVALTLRAVGGLTTAEIATAFLVPEATMTRRITRAKQRLREVGASFAAVPNTDLTARLPAVRHVLYLVFNEGYVAGTGASLGRPDLTTQALWLARELHARRPDDGEAAGLLALMVLTEARSAARIGTDGVLVPLAEQDRSRWDRHAITEGVDLITTSLAGNAPGPFQVQAAIAAVHAEAPSDAETDWTQIVGLYEVLEQLAPNPVVTLNRAIAVGMAVGPATGLRMLTEVAAGPLAGHHRVYAAEGFLRQRAGEMGTARSAYLEAARLASNRAEQRLLLRRAASCGA